MIKLFKQPGQGLPHELKEPILIETVKEIDEHDTGSKNFFVVIYIAACKQ